MTRALYAPHSSHRCLSGCGGRQRVCAQSFKCRQSHLQGSVGSSVTSLHPRQTSSADSRFHQSRIRNLPGAGNHHHLNKEGIRSLLDAGHPQHLKGEETSSLPDAGRHPCLTGGGIHSLLGPIHHRSLPGGGISSLPDVSRHRSPNKARLRLPALGVNYS